MKKILAIIVLLISTVISASPASVTLAWDANTEPDIAGYRMYFGSPVGSYSEIVNCGNVTNLTIETLIPGNTYAFYVTCYNTSGLESEPSNVVQYTVPINKPASPRTLRFD